jgi:hypothetical protein
MQFKQKIYWEEQVGLYCGLHSINSLLQGPCFTNYDLDIIAEGLDNEERKLVKNSSVQKESQNSSIYGNYSIQVITMALQQKGKFVLEPFSVINLTNENTLKEQAFIFHSQKHWYVSRKVAGIWYDLNSIQKTHKPVKLNEFYLSAFLASAYEEGYNIYCIKGSPLPTVTSIVGLYESHQHYFSADEILQINDKPKEDKPFQGKGVSIGTESITKQKAAASKKGKSSKINNDEDEQLKLALEVSINSFVSNLQKIIPQEPKEGAANSIDVKIRIDGTEFKRRFDIYDSINDVKNVVRLYCMRDGNIGIMQQFPKAVLDGARTLQSYGYVKSQMLIAEYKS